MRRQFLSESGAICFISLFLAFGIAALLLRSFGILIDRQLVIQDLFHPVIVSASLLLTFLTISIAGGYPAFVLAGLDPMRVIKGKVTTSSSTGIMRKGLLITQFVISIGLAGSTFVLWDQLQFMRTQNLGFDKENIVLISPSEESKNQYVALKNELLAVPGVVGVTTAPLPGYDYVIRSTHKLEGQENEAGKLPWIHTFDVDYDFLRLMDIELIAGRNFDPGLQGDLHSSVLINRAALHHFNVSNPEDVIGKWAKRNLRIDGIWTEQNILCSWSLGGFSQWINENCNYTYFSISNYRQR